MTVAPAGFTSGCAAALTPAVQPTTCPPLGPRPLSQQAVAPLGPAPGCQSQALRLFGVPFHRISATFMEAPTLVCFMVAYDYLPRTCSIFTQTQSYAALVGLARR